jgi:hypothetical protein
MTVNPSSHPARDRGLEIIDAGDGPLELLTNC